MLKISATKFICLFVFFLFPSYFNFFIVYFSIVDEQYYISFRCAASNSVIHIDVSILFQVLFKNPICPGYHQP